MRVPVVIFAVLLALCGVVLAIALIEEAPDSRGLDHPVHETMRQGGSPERHDRVLFWGWLYGTLSIVLFASMLALGLRRRGALPTGAKRSLLFGSALYAAVFALLVLSYRAYAESGADGSLSGSFPRPSAWMLYGVWPVPLIFTFFYVRNFDRWVMSDDDVADFERLVAESRGGRDSGGPD